MNWFTFLTGLGSVYIAVCLSYVMVVYDKDTDGKFVDYLAKVMAEVAMRGAMMRIRNSLPYG